MNKEEKDKLWNDLKMVVTVKLEECEEKAGVKVGRDNIEREECINRTAGMVYGHLVNEVKATVKQFVCDVHKRVGGFG